MAAAKVFLEALRTWNVSGERIGAVWVNRVETSLPLDVHSLKTELKCSIIGIVHHAGDALIISQRAGTPLVIAQSEHPAAKMFCEIAKRLQIDPVAAISFLRTVSALAVL